MQHTIWAVTMALVSAALGFQNAAAEDAMCRIETSSGSLDFKSADGGLTLSRLTARAAGRLHEWVDVERALPIWTVVVQDAQGNRHKLNALDGPAAVREASGSRLTLVWSGIDPGDVEVVMTWSVRGPDIVGGLEVEAKGPDYALWDVTFPEVGPLAMSDAVYSITPYGWGIIRGNLSGRPLDEGVYPSCVRAMPFVAVSDGNTGVYLGIEDNPGYALRLFVGRREGGETVSIGLRHEIEDMGLANRYRLPYSVVLTPYEGDWYEAGRIYRRSAATSPWASVPPLEDRRDIPRWLLDTDLWYIGPCHDDASARQILDFARYFDVPTSAHVYNWHEIPFDDHYPEYFPAKPGFKDAVAKVQEAGVAVTPYINGRLWDARTDSWVANRAEEAACLDEKGDRYEEVYGSGVPLSPMCPATALWQQTVTSLVDRLVNEVGVRGVYVDQISAAAAKRCFAQGHGHPRGGGASWIKGYRELLRQARSVLPEGALLTTEENADPWNDLLDAFLMVNTRPGRDEIVPLYPVVYGGRVVFFGFQYFQGSDYSLRYPLRLKLARTFVFGSQMGWLNEEILKEENKAEATFLKTLCQARHTARDAFQFGEFLPPPAINGAGTVTWVDEAGDARAEMAQPAVLGGLWLTPAGKRKLALVNVADDARTVTVTLDRRHLGSAEAERVALRGGDGSPAAELPRAAPGVYRGEVTVPGVGAMVFECIQ